MFHSIELRQWQESEDNEMILFSVEALPLEVYEVLKRFTRIPNYQAVLPFLVAYDLCPVTGLKSFPIMFCHGRPGSGKSTIGEILQRFNPRSYGDDSYLQSSDTAKGWEQNIPAYRRNHNSEERSYPLVFIDDLMPGTFSSINGDLKLALLKQMVNANGVIRRGGKDGDPLQIEVFIKTVTGSIHDLPSIDGLQELERRSIVVKHKNIDEWDSEHDDFTRSVQIENHNDYRFAPDYDETRHLWFNANAEKVREDRRAVKAFLKTSDLLPSNKREFLYPIIAMSITCGFFSSPIEACMKFREAFLMHRAESCETALQTLLKQWVFSSMSPYRARLALVEDMEGMLSLDIPYSEVAVFLRKKLQNMELSGKETHRVEVIAAMGLMGFKPVSEEGETIFRYTPEVKYNE